MTLAPEQPVHDLAPDTAAELIDLVGAVREHATRLIVDLSTAPSAVRVRAGDVLVELEWQSAAPVAPDHPAPTAHSSTPATANAPAGPVPPDTRAAGPPGERTIAAPSVGTFYRSPEPGAPPFVAEGDLVAPGRQVGIVEVMKLMIPVHADRAGRIARFLVDDNEPVEYGQPLVALDAAAE
ncbi:acetyl-CoA carboxylase [Streptodolium elevatio]|uniref:Biotin carboxyl carrier protein of acetyl-CoA carboxylase n=1 Tax=Streptodolium elevatio TaxID=3157996 RepID=A0ABV3DPW7_9ACTN